MRLDRFRIAGGSTYTPAYQKISLPKGLSGLGRPSFRLEHKPPTLAKDRTHEKGI
jgi:hypothetical protein